VKTAGCRRVSAAAVLMATVSIAQAQTGAAPPAPERPADRAQPTPAPALAPARAPAGEPASAGDEQGNPAPSLKLDLGPAWTVQVEPMGWYAGPAGDLKLPGGGQEVQLSTLNMDSTRLSPAGELHINADHWRFSFSGAGYSADRTTTSNSTFRIGAVSVRPDDALRTSYDWTTVQLTAGYRIWSHDFDTLCKEPINACPAVLNLYAIGGGRMHDIDISVESDAPGRAGRAGTDQFYGEVIAGVRAEFEIAHDFTIDLELSGGGMGDSDRSIASFDIIAGFQWRPVENVGVQIGWRQLAYWLQDGDGDKEFSLNGETAGLYFGVVVRF
jgi:hypothetical protein